MPDPIRVAEPWEDWVLRQKMDPKSCAGQLVAAGVSFETALLINMLGRIHEELISIAEVLGQGTEGEDWRG